MNEKTNEIKAAATSYDHLTVTNDLTVGTSSNPTITLKNDGSIEAGSSVKNGNFGELELKGYSSNRKQAQSLRLRTNGSDVDISSSEGAELVINNNGGDVRICGKGSGDKPGTLTVDGDLCVKGTGGIQVDHSSTICNDLHVSGTITGQTLTSNGDLKLRNRVRISSVQNAHAIEFYIASSKPQAILSKIEDTHGAIWLRSYEGKYLKLSPTTHGEHSYSLESRPSDAYLKKDIKPLQNATEKLIRLQGIHFTWNEQGLQEKTKHIEESFRSAEDTPEANQKVWDAEKERIRKEHSGTYKGFIAQEVEKIFPEWVQRNEAGYKTIRMDELNVVLVEAVKELNAEVKALQAQNKAIMAKLEALEKHTQL